MTGLCRNQVATNRSPSVTTVLLADVRMRSTSAPGRGLVLFATLFAIVSLSQFSATALGSAGSAAPHPEASSGAQTPFERQGMWIWYVDSSEGGSAARILTRASGGGIGTVYIKAGDGGDVWGQFSTPLIRALQRGGLDVCAWQFVYGDAPIAEAKVGAARRRQGGQLPGDRRRGPVRRQVRSGGNLHSGAPLAHRRRPSRSPLPAFPTSTTTLRSPTRSSSAQAAPPTTSRRCIGRQSGPRSGRSIEHTYLFNRLWGHPIFPLGQTYESPGRAATLRLFRSFAASYGGRRRAGGIGRKLMPGAWGALGAASHRCRRRS